MDDYHDGVGDGDKAVDEDDDGDSDVDVNDYSQYDDRLY